MMQVALRRCIWQLVTQISGVVLMALQPSEYSRAVTPQIRQAGNRLSGLAETAYASLLA